MPRSDFAASRTSVALVRGLLVLLLVAAAVVPAGALNQRIYPLQELIKDADAIVLGRAAAVDAARMRAVLLVEQPLKGTVPFKWMTVDVSTGGWGHPTAMIRRLGPGVPVLLFAARVRGRHVVLGFQNGTWFQVTAADGPEPDRLGWTFTHLEVFLRRTYAGGTPELEQVVRDVLAGKRAAPAPNLALGPGMGPEVPRDYRSARPLPPLPEFVQAALAAPRSGPAAREIAVRKLTPAEQQWVDERSRQFDRAPEEVARLLALAGYEARDAQWALELERDYGRGGNRAWVRSAEEILELKQRSDRLCWLDVRGVLARAGELFMPVSDPVEMIHDLRTKFTWDELDPLLDHEKWGRKKLAEEIEGKLAVRMSDPLGPQDRLQEPLFRVDFGAMGQGALPMEAAGWRLLPGREWDLPRRQFAWDGGDSGDQRPGSAKLHSPGSRKNPIPNAPPRPGIPLAAGAGKYSGAALWFAAGVGDYEGRERSHPGAYAHYDQQWTQVRQGEARSFLVTAQVFTPDHTEVVGEPRPGWFYTRRPSRYIDIGIRLVDAETRSLCLTQEPAVLLKIEPRLDRFDRVLLRVDIRLEKVDGKPNSQGRNEARIIAFADGVGEVARAVVDLNRARRGGLPALDTSDEGVLFAPVFGIRTAGEGYVPEFYLADLQVRQINEGSVAVVRNAPLSVPEVAPKPPRVKPIKGPRNVVIAIDTSSSMAPRMDRARRAALEVLTSLKAPERFRLLSCARDVVPYSSGWVTATPENVKKASEWVRILPARVGTNTAALLEHVFSPKDVNYVVLVTDGGEPSRGVRSEEELLALARAKNTVGARVDAVLVGPATPGSFVSRIVEESGGRARIQNP